MKQAYSRLLAIFLLMGVLFALGGCATLGPPFKPVVDIPAGKGLIYIYRPSSFIGGAVSYDVKLGDGTVITTLHNGGYSPFFADPGETEIWGKTESKSSLTIDVKAGQTYYVRGTVGVGFFVGRPHLLVVDNKVGVQEIAECKLIPEDKAEK